MRKCKILLLIGLMVALICTAVGCNLTNSNNQPTGTISGVKELHLKLSEVSNEKLLEGVKVIKEDGTETVPELLLDGVDLTKSGFYTITYKYGATSVNTGLYIYGLPTLKFNGEEIANDTLSITYRQANESYDFEKGIKAFDSFGNELTVTKATGSDDFDGVVGDYAVTYKAEDGAGNQLNKTVTFNVTGEKMPQIEDSTYVIGLSNELAFSTHGVKTGWLYLDGVRVPTENYYISDDALVFMPKYLLNDLGIGNFDFYFETLEGYTSFALTIEDQGYPIFDIPTVMMSYAYGQINVDKPTKLWDAHEDYDYEYTLKKGSDFAIAEEKEESLFLVNRFGDHLDAGDYTLSVKATSSINKTITVDYNFTVDTKNVPTFAGGEKSSFIPKTLEDGNEVYVWEKVSGSDAWSGRLGFSIPKSRYMALTFDIFVASSDKATEDGKANVNLVGMISEMAENYNYKEIDATEGVFDIEAGEFINKEDIEVGKWYTVIFKTDRCQSKDQAGYLYLGATEKEKDSEGNLVLDEEQNPIGLKVGAEIYLDNIEFHEKGNADMDVSSSSKLYPVLLNEQTYGTKVAYKFVSNGKATWDGRFEAKAPKTVRFQLKYEIYVESCTASIGDYANVSLYNTIIDTGNANLIQKKFGVKDIKTGKFVNRDDIKLNTWYEVIVEINANPNATTVYFYPPAEEIVAYYKNIRFEGKNNYDGPAIKKAAENANESSYTMVMADEVEGVSGQNVYEYKRNANTSNVTAWNSRLYFEADERFDTLTFDIFVKDTSAKTNGKINYTIRGCVGSDYARFTKIVEKGTTNEVAKSLQMEVGKWYTVTYNVADNSTNYIYFETDASITAYITNYVFV